MLKKLFWLFFITLLLCLISAGGGYYWYVVLHPGEEIEQENINSILGKESPVFYNDGVTRLGVFFDQAHRQYVPYDQIPVNFINALVASEDNRFFEHFGFDVVGILRAAVKNLEAGKIVQGGSTLTQQTAKNLFKRETRSVGAKLKELLFALRLEYHYEKEKIFEFYANQFYVSGNGHGLGVAARYYFDKKPEELNLLECAYIAGSVKRPNYYNPFIKSSKESSDKALDRGRVRVNYVLTKMREEGMISEYQYGVAKLSQIAFKQGQVGYSLDYVMEMVKDAVTSTEVIEALEEHDITNIATSGVRIITTVDKVLQEHTLYSLRHDLSRLDVRLRGYERDEVQKELDALDYQGDIVPDKNAFLFGTVKDIVSDEKKPEVTVFFGRKYGEGLIDKDGLTRLVTARLRWKETPWSTVAASDYGDLLKQLKVGDKIWVSVREKESNGRLLLDLEKFPQINGGALVLKDGLIKAMAGGVENRFYNRAIYAKRTMGSSFKPFVFAAALQLGWNSADRLQNKRDVFVFQKQPYFPRPDHDSPYDEVSLSWAGVTSENVASVWLLAHLCDKLDKDQFKEVASKTGLTPRGAEGEEEPYSRFRARIRDQHGIVVNQDVLRQAAFDLAVKNIETDLIFEGRDLEYSVLENMHYGLGFKDFRESLKKELNDKKRKVSSNQRQEIGLRQSVLSHNFLDLEVLRNDFTDYVVSVERQQYGNRDFPLTEEQRNRKNWSNLYYDQLSKRYCFNWANMITAGMLAVDKERLRRFLENGSPEEISSFWEDVYLDSTLTVKTFDLLHQQIEREMKILNDLPPYSLDVLASVEDYRMLVGLHYLIALARQLGVKSDLDPVLSFPLGSNVVTLLETLRVYEGLATGETVVSGRNVDENEDLRCIIDRIESMDGEILYQPQRLKKRVLAPETAMEIGHILENVIKFGTGRYADEHIKLAGGGESGESSGALKNLELSIPVIGKTGTANRYTNASFFGYLPGLSPSNDSLVLHGGYGVGVYVGFDDNMEMRKGATKITGSAGALPIWSEIVNDIVREKEYASHLDTVDLSFYGLSLQRPDLGQMLISADPDNGGLTNAAVKTVKSAERYSPSILTFGTIGENISFKPARRFLPFWKTDQLPVSAEDRQ